MTAHSRTVSRLVAAVLISIVGADLSSAQDTPLYRDPSPTEGPRIEGPLLAPLPPRPTSTPPPPSSLGPFQPRSQETAPALEPIRDPLLIVQPIPPPQPAMPLAGMPPLGDVQIRRKTTIRPPNGPCGRCHEWIREALFGPPKPPVETTYNGSKQGFFFSLFHLTSSEAGAPAKPFSWPTWPL